MKDSHVCCTQPAARRAKQMKTLRLAIAFPLVSLMCHIGLSGALADGESGSTRQEAKLLNGQRSTYFWMFKLLSPLKNPRRFFICLRVNGLQRTDRRGTRPDYRVMAAEEIREHEL
jgi:hypothetical protein